jgi:hypothetical protein
VAYRTRRAFRAQYELLLVASSFEEASGRLELSTRPAGHRSNRRLTRDVAQRRAALDEQLQEFREEVFSRLAPGDLLSGVRELVLEQPIAAPPSSTAESRAQPDPLGLAGGHAWSPAFAATCPYACAAAWAVTAVEILTRGITNRPSLIVAEVTALALSPLALLRSAERSGP